MLSILLLLFAWISNCSAQSSVSLVRSPWEEPTDPLWMVTNARDRRSSFTFAKNQLKSATIVYKDKLPKSDGNASYASLLSNEHVGVGAGFSSFDEEPTSLARITRRAQENRQRNVVPVSLCGYEETDGSIKFESMWMPSKTIDYQLQFDNQNQTMANFTAQGYYVVSVCSTKTTSNRTVTPSVVIIWHRQPNYRNLIAENFFVSSTAADVLPQQRISIDVPESECTSASLRNAKERFYPVVAQLFNKGNDVRCTAVWQKMMARSLKYELRIGGAPYDVTNLVDKQMMPRQVSVYKNVGGTEQLMVLWTNYDTRNISFDGMIYNETNDNVPVNWLPGSTAGMKAEDKSNFEQHVTAILKLGQIPSISFALSRNEQLKRSVAFGYANPLTNEAATVTTKYRSGSISKVLTAAAIFSLIDQSKLSLNSTVFGPRGILGTEYGTQPYSQFLQKVEVVHLLEHSSGGWGDETTEDVLIHFEGFNQKAFIGIEIDQYGPVFEPGTVWDYSNFGYYLLGVIITKLSGKPYEQYVKETLWRPAGIPDDRIGIENRWFSERQPNEAVFQIDALLSTYDAYDLIDSDRVASAGGWIASPTDLLRVATQFNGFKCIPDVISQSSFNQMTTPSNATLGYTNRICRGLFMGQDFFGYMHTGYYAGGTAYYERYNNGVEIVVMQSKGDDTPDITNEIQKLKRLFIDLTPDWPQQDLYLTDFYYKLFSPQEATHCT